MEHLISDMIASGNTSNAYVIREGKFNILFKDNDIWHVIERFGNCFLSWLSHFKYCFFFFFHLPGYEYVSYKLHFYSAIEDRMNNLTQRCVEHGIIKYLLAKNQRILSGTMTEIPKFVPTIVKPVFVTDMRELFLIYAVGIVISLITFIAEKIYFRRSFIGHYIP